MGKTDALRFELTGGEFRTEILGSHRLLLEGSGGMLELSPERIGFRCGRREVWVTGESLTLVCVDEDAAVITGRIGTVEYR